MLNFLLAYVLQNKKYCKIIFELIAKENDPLIITVNLISENSYSEYDLLTSSVKNSYSTYK